MISVITGASGGIGRWIAHGLAQAGHDLVLIGRTPPACDWLRAAHPGVRITTLTADLSSLAETRRATQILLDTATPIDVLVNNAGTFAPRRELTAEGHERVLAVNHLAPFLLTSLLRPLLEQAAGGARIVNIGSSTSDRARIDPDDLEGARRWGLVHTYGQSKLALLMTTRLWAEALAGTGVVANVVHPGAVATGLVRAGGPIGLAWRLMRPFLLTEAQGADTPVHVATDPAFAAISGAYVKKRRVVAPNPLALDGSLCLRVWDATERLTGL